MALSNSSGWDLTIAPSGGAGLITRYSSLLAFSFISLHNVALLFVSRLTTTYLHPVMAPSVGWPRSGWALDDIFHLFYEIGWR